MAHLLSLCAREQKPDKLMKDVRESTQREEEEEEDELIFVGVEHVSKDADIVFVKAFSNSKPVISKILNRVTPGSYSRRQKGRFGPDPTHCPQLASYVNPAENRMAIAPAPRPLWCSAESSVTTESPSEPSDNMSSADMDAGKYSESLTPRIQSVVGAVLPIGGQGQSPCESKKMSTWERNDRNSKTFELDDGTPRAGSPAVAPSGISLVTDRDTHSEDVCLLSHVQNGMTFPGVDTDEKAHFGLRHSEGVIDLAGLARPDCVSGASQNKALGPMKDTPIMLLNDFYYGQHQGDGPSEQKTHTTFKCLSCLKVLKNIKFMNHVRHHLELERQRGDSWEHYTTCQHCHRKFPIPFLLQCHIERVHTSQEPSAVCKICELSFKTDQVLLQHMKDTHKPGEMPYVCQVCSYRSSAFADVEAHFRTCHENTKNLLCPFCLKIFKRAVPYMDHCRKHQRKKGFLCSKCRLQFLSRKEETEHKCKNHQTFKKPEALSHLAPEAEICIQTSIQPESEGVASIVVRNAPPSVSPVKTTKRMRVNS
ncbi:zinc finger protein 280A [Ochotona princeps]|uniref:zinc finger protein 280A n=1 Tax=Ochotona princeps TaxID=9978 RepID=UPI0027155D6A|nr:zinc finger protein 280A [Ochotona princeps]